MLRISTVKRDEAVIVKGNLEEARSAFGVQACEWGSQFAARAATWFTCQPQHPKHASSKIVVNV
jgi:hypothetical protein